MLSSLFQLIVIVFRFRRYLEFENIRLYTGVTIKNKYEYMYFHFCKLSLPPYNWYQTACVYNIYARARSQGHSTLWYQVVFPPVTRRSSRNTTRPILLISSIHGIGRGVPIVDVVLQVGDLSRCWKYPIFYSTETKDMLNACCTLVLSVQCSNVECVYYHMIF